MTQPQALLLDAMGTLIGLRQSVGTSMAQQQPTTAWSWKPKRWIAPSRRPTAKRLH